MTLTDLISQINLSSDLSFTAQKVDGSDDVALISYEGMDEFPILVTVNEYQTKVQMHIAQASEVKPDMVEELNSVLLNMNPLLSLSAVGLDQGDYIAYGVLSSDSKFESFTKEVDALVENSVNEIFPLFTDYLVQES